MGRPYGAVVPGAFQSPDGANSDVREHHCAGTALLPAASTTGIAEAGDAAGAGSTTERGAGVNVSTNNAIPIPSRMICASRTQSVMSRVAPCGQKSTEAGMRTEYESG
jgi:hypothetical protein